MVVNSMPGDWFGYIKRMVANLFFPSTEKMLEKENTLRLKIIAVLCSFLGAASCVAIFSKSIYPFELEFPMPLLVAIEMAFLGFIGVLAIFLTILRSNIYLHLLWAIISALLGILIASMSILSIFSLVAIFSFLFSGSLLTNEWKVSWLTTSIIIVLNLSFFLRFIG